MQWLIMNVFRYSNHFDVRNTVAYRHVSLQLGRSVKDEMSIRVFLVRIAEIAPLPYRNAHERQKIRRNGIPVKAKVFPFVIYGPIRSGLEYRLGPSESDVEDIGIALQLFYKSVLPVELKRQSGRQNIVPSESHIEIPYVSVLLADRERDYDQRDRNDVLKRYQHDSHDLSFA